MLRSSGLLRRVSWPGAMRSGAFGILPACLLGLLLTGTLAGPALAADADDMPPLPHPVKLTACIFDPAGKNGPIASTTSDLVLDARRWGLIVEPHIYTDEKVAADDFAAGQCEIVGISTLRAGQFSRTVGSIDAPGNLRSYDEAKTLIRVMAQPDFMPFTYFGRYQVIGVIPIGSVFVMLRDRNMASIDKIAGKKVAVLDWNKSQARMIESLGAQPVPSDLTNFGGKFNNGMVDVIAAPALFYEPLELYRGIGTKGGIVRFPIMEATGSLLLRRDLVLPKIPDLDARLLKMRGYGLRFVDDFVRRLKQTEARIPQSAWIDLSPEDQKRYSRMLREARLKMTADGVYDTNMMQLLRKVRCKYQPSNEECSLYDE